MRKKIGVLVFLIGCISLSTAAVANELTDVELLNLRWGWKVYNQQKSQYVPFFEEPDTKAVRFELDLNKYRNSHVRLSLPANYFVWVEDELVHGTSIKSKIYFRLDSLYQTYKKNRVYLTLYNPAFQSHDVGTHIVNRVEHDLESMATGNERARNGNYNLDLFIIISIVTFSLFAIFRTFNIRLFKEYFSLDKIFQHRQNFDLIIAHSPFAWPNIGFIAFYAVLIGNSIVNLELFQSLSRVPSLLFSENAILMGIKISGCCFLFIALKLLLISVSAELFKIQKIKLLHFFTYIRYSLIIAISLFSLSVVNGVLGGALVTEGSFILQGLVLVVWSWRLVLIFFVLNKIYTFRKLHLFSYLCSTELIPLLLFFKIFLK